MEMKMGMGSRRSHKRSQATVGKERPDIPSFPALLPLPPLAIFFRAICHSDCLFSCFFFFFVL